MALERAKLTDVAFVASSPGSVYTNPASKKTFIKGVALHNTNTSNETVVVHVVPNSSGSIGSAAAANRIYKVSLAQDETLLLPLNVDGYPVTLTDTNDSLQIGTTTASKVTCIVLGDRE